MLDKIIGPVVVLVARVMKICYAPSRFGCQIYGFARCQSKSFSLVVGQIDCL